MSAVKPVMRNFAMPDLPMGGCGSYAQHMAHLVQGVHCDGSPMEWAV